MACVASPLAPDSPSCLHDDVAALYGEAQKLYADAQQDFNGDDAPAARRCYRDAQEWFVDPTTRYLQETGLTPSRWVRATGPRTVSTANPDWTA